VRRIAVLGLGEAGAAIAGDLAAAAGEGARVAAYDPVAPPPPEGVVRHDDPVSAVADADLVLALTPASGAAAALDSVVGALRPGAIYADLSTASPESKHRLASTAAAAGVGFVDVALMAPVPGNGLRTPSLAAGTAADAFAATMRPLGMPVEVVGPEAGQAAMRKLLRSVVMKGLAQLLIEAVRAAEAAGLAAETWDQLLEQLSDVDEALLRRLVSGTPLHARRRLDEMEATVELLDELGVDATMSRATTARLRQIAADPTVVPEPPSGPHESGRIRRSAGPGAPTAGGPR
jgi:3-hydroxyisobutyrate dehydrogenase-like beta-hydroxyacid dehydrogenase